MTHNQGVISIWYQELDPDLGIKECIGIELAGGLKRYLRIWLPVHMTSTAIDWGWRMHETAVKVYPNDTHV